MSSYRCLTASAPIVPSQTRTYASAASCAAFEGDLANAANPLDLLANTACALENRPLLRSVDSFRDIRIVGSASLAARSVPIDEEDGDDDDAIDPACAELLASAAVDDFSPAFKSAFAPLIDASTPAASVALPLPEPRSAVVGYVALDAVVAGRVGGAPLSPAAADANPNVARAINDNIASTVDEAWWKAQPAVGPINAIVDEISKDNDEEEQAIVAAAATLASSKLVWWASSTVKSTAAAEQEAAPVATAPSLHLKANTERAWWSASSVAKAALDDDEPTSATLVYADEEAGPCPIAATGIASEVVWWASSRQTPSVFVVAVEEPFKGDRKVACAVVTAAEADSDDKHGSDSITEASDEASDEAQSSTPVSEVAWWAASAKSKFAAPVAVKQEEQRKVAPATSIASLICSVDTGCAESFSSKLVPPPRLPAEDSSLPAAIDRPQRRGGLAFKTKLASLSRAAKAAWRKRFSRSSSFKVVATPAFAFAPAAVEVADVFTRPTAFLMSDTSRKVSAASMTTSSEKTYAEARTPSPAIVGGDHFVYAYSAGTVSARSLLLDRTHANSYPTDWYTRAEDKSFFASRSESGVSRGRHEVAGLRGRASSPFMSVTATGRF